MNFRTLDRDQALRAHLEQRLNQLENEYLSNESALIVTTVGGEPDVDTDAGKEAERLRGNMVAIEAAHTAVADRLDADEAAKSGKANEKA